MGYRIAIFAAIVLLHALILVAPRYLASRASAVDLGPAIEATLIELPRYVQYFTLPQPSADLQPVQFDADIAPPQLPNLAVYDPTVEFPVDLATISSVPAVGAAQRTTPPMPDARFPLPSVESFYPAAASAQSHEAGVVRLSVFVQRNGSIGLVLIQQSSGSARLDDAARQYVRALHLTPGRRAGIAQGMWMPVELTFSSVRSFVRFAGN